MLDAGRSGNFGLARLHSRRPPTRLVCRRVRSTPTRSTPSTIVEHDRGRPQARRPTTPISPNMGEEFESRRDRHETRLEPDAEPKILLATPDRRRRTLSLLRSDDKTDRYALHRYSGGAVAWRADTFSAPRDPTQPEKWIAYHGELTLGELTLDRRGTRACCANGRGTRSTAAWTSRARRTSLRATAAGARSSRFVPSSTPLPPRPAPMRQPDGWRALRLRASPPPRRR